MFFQCGTTEWMLFMNQQSKQNLDSNCFWILFFWPLSTFQMYLMHLVQQQWLTHWPIAGHCCIESLISLFLQTITMHKILIFIFTMYMIMRCLKYLEWQNKILSKYLNSCLWWAVSFFFINMLTILCSSYIKVLCFPNLLFVAWLVKIFDSIL